MLDLDGGKYWLHVNSTHIHGGTRKSLAWLVLEPAEAMTTDDELGLA